MEYDRGTRTGRTDLDCVACGHEVIPVDDGESATCPNCGESYCLVVGDGFALMETGGWAARVTFDESDDLKRGLAN